MIKLTVVIFATISLFQIQLGSVFLGAINFYLYTEFKGIRKGPNTNSYPEDFQENTQYLSAYQQSYIFFYDY